MLQLYLISCLKGAKLHLLCRVRLILKDNINQSRT